jgi:hypothetical protein
LRSPSLNDTFFGDFFLELATRVAAQPLDRGSGSLREALNSLHELFALTRTELAAMPSVTPPPPGKISVQSYVLKILNAEIRPFLTRWHVRLSSWEKTGMPETSWPLATTCRQELDLMRSRVLRLAWELGEALRITDLAGILPLRSKENWGLLVAADKAASENSHLSNIGVKRAKAGWRIFVEVVSRISTQPLASEAGLLYEALESLHILIGLIREELKSMPPTPSASPGDDTVEYIALRLLNLHLRPFLANWHPRVDEWRKRNRTEEGDAAACRRELEEMRSRMINDVRQLGELVGVQHVDEMLSAASITAQGRIGKPA